MAVYTLEDGSKLTGTFSRKGSVHGKVAELSKAKRGQRASMFQRLAKRVAKRTLTIEAVGRRRGFLGLRTSV